jgi:hypothetical protein
MGGKYICNMLVVCAYRCACLLVFEAVGCELHFIMFSVFLPTREGFYSLVFAVLLWQVLTVGGSLLFMQVALFEWLAVAEVC